MSNDMGTGKRIAYLRRQKGFTQEELAEKLKISTQAVSKWENGHNLPETGMLPLLSKILDSSIDFLLLPSTTAKNRPLIHDIEEIPQCDRVRVTQALAHFDKAVIAKALKGVSPPVSEYIQSLFPDTPLLNMAHTTVAIRVSEIENIHAQILEALNKPEDPSSC